MLDFLFKKDLKDVAIKNKWGFNDLWKHVEN